MLNSSYIEALEHLRRSVAALPSSVPTGHPSGIINRFFRVQPCDLVKDPWIATSEAYTRCFTDSPNSTKRAIDNIRRGQYGMDCVVKFFEGLKTCPGVSTSNLLRIEQTIRDIAELVDKKVRLLVPSNAEKPMPGHQASAPSLELSKPRAHAHGSEEDFTDLIRYEEALQRDSEDEISDKQSHVHPQPSRITNNGTSSRPGPQDSVRQWALSHFEAPVPGEFENRSGAPAWLFKCKHCGLVCRLPRTAGCEIIEHEPRLISSSNLSKHLRQQCKKIPQAEGWEAAQARTQQVTTLPTSNSASLSLGAIFVSETPVPPPPPNALSKSIFRSALIRGMVQDTFPMTFGEGEGMKMVFQLVNPLVSLPSHHTSRRDLDALFRVLLDRFKQVMQKQVSRLSLTSGAWSSKSSVYSISGAFVTFIDKSWNLQELVLDIVHLDADHAGASMGKKIFQSLQHRHAAQNLIASMTDNGSNNRTMNRQIYKQVRGQLGNRLSEKNMSVLCACHAWHLTCSNLLSELDVVEVTEEEDGYDVAKAFDLGERIEESEEIRQEEARMRGLDGEDADWIPDEESDDDFDDMEPDSDPVEGDPLADDLRHSMQSDNSVNPQKRRTKALNPIQKIHAIAVHCTSSPQRRKVMAGYIRLYCFVVLAVIKSMAIRWNTVLAELRRALLLRPAFDYWTNTLEIGKTGKARQAALQLKQELTMSDPEWEVVAEVVRILQPFEEATLSFSKHGKPHLPDVLPTFVKLRTELQNSRYRLQKEYGAENDPYGLIKAISAGEHKLEKYFKIALQNDSVLVSSILHPGMRLRFFQDEHVWGNTMRRGKELIASLFEVYKLETANSESPNQPPLRPSLHTSWSDQLLQLSGASKPDLDDELSRFFGNVYAYKLGTNILLWWKEHELDFPILSRIARDYLGIPATSVSVERLFSQCKLVMSDYRAMSVETARRLITCKQWLEAGLGTNLPDFV